VLTPISSKYQPLIFKTVVSRFLLPQDQTHNLGSGLSFPEFDILYSQEYLLTLLSSRIILPERGGAVTSHVLYRRPRNCNWTCRGRYGFGYCRLGLRRFPLVMTCILRTYKYLVKDDVVLLTVIRASNAFNRGL
jgi:hypothetical protein